jgi:hypothetical protein
MEIAYMLLLAPAVVWAAMMAIELFVHFNDPLRPFLRASPTSSIDEILACRVFPRAQEARKEADRQPDAGTNVHPPALD